MAHILVIGDIMLDIAAPVRENTTYEDAAVSYIGECWRYYPGGAANVAAIVQRMGHEVTICGCLGSDWAGYELSKLLPVSRWISWGATATTIKLRAYSDQGVAVRLDCEVSEALTCPFPPSSSQFDAVIFSDYYKGVFGPRVDSAKVRSIIDSGVPTIIDPHVRGRNGLWKGATVATPNEREHDSIGPIGTDWTAVTMGAAGANLFNGTRFHSSITQLNPCECPQVVGAGDAFTAALAVGLAEGQDIIDASISAVSFAGDYVSHPRI